MVSIIIYTTKEKLKHKQDRNLGFAYWNFPHYPTKFNDDINIEDIVFFAYEGFIQGYFENAEAHLNIGKPIPFSAVKFYPSSWTELKEKIPIKPFQGFKYADKVKELDEVVLRSSP